MAAGARVGARAGADRRPGFAAVQQRRNRDARPRPEARSGLAWPAPKRQTRSKDMRKYSWPRAAAGLTLCTRLQQRATQQRACRGRPAKASFRVCPVGAGHTGFSARALLYGSCHTGFARTGPIRASSVRITARPSPSVLHPSWRFQPARVRAGFRAFRSRADRPALHFPGRGAALADRVLPRARDRSRAGVTGSALPDRRLSLRPAAAHIRACDGAHRPRTFNRMAGTATRAS